MGKPASISVFHELWPNLAVDSTAGQPADALPPSSGGYFGAQRFRAAHRSSSLAEEGEPADAPVVRSEIPSGLLAREVELPALGQAPPPPGGGRRASSCR